MHRALLMVIMHCLARCGALPYNKEPLCTSRYDFEEKILEKVLRMEIWMETMKTRVDTDLDKVAKDIDTFTHELRGMKRDIFDKNNNVDAHVKALEGKTDSKLLEVDQHVSIKIKDIDTHLKTLEAKTDSKMNDVEEQTNTAIREMKQTLDSTIKPNVVFQAKDVKGQASSNQVIKFTSTLENVGLGYNLTTGCFTAPINGTYWFSAQICSNTNKYVTVSIVIRGTIAARSYAHNVNTVGVASVHALSVLRVGDTVCLETGSVSSTAVYNDANHCIGSFMGASVN